MKISGSNSLKILVEMKVDLTNQIKKKKQKYKSLGLLLYLRSQFENVNINGSNLNRAQLFDCNWTNLRINDLHQLQSHTNSVTSVCFSPNNTIIASGSSDKSIRLWDVKTGQSKSNLDGHDSCVISVCFSPDGTTLASGNEDKSICLWGVITG